MPGLVAFAVRWYVGEPKIFLDRVAAARGKIPLGLLVKDTATTKISLGMLILCAVQNFGYYGLMIWLPSYLSTRFGYSLTQSALWTAVTVLGMACGIWAFGQFADRVGRRPALLTFQAGAFVMVLVYSQLTDATALLIGGAVMGVFVNGMLGGYGALLSELYPTEARATAGNVLFNLGRGVGGFGPFVVGALAAAYSFAIAIGLLATIYVVDIIATVFLIPERKGAPLA
jgi:MFS family permease